MNKKGMAEEKPELEKEIEGLFPEKSSSEGSSETSDEKEAPSETSDEKEAPSEKLTSFKEIIRNPVKAAIIILCIAMPILSFLFIGPTVGFLSLIISIIIFSSLTGVTGAIWKKISESRFFPYIVLGIVAITIIIVIIWAIRVGVFQQTVGTERETKSLLNQLQTVLPLKQISRFIRDPFGVNPEESQYEPVQSQTVTTEQSITEAMSVSANSYSDNVQYSETVVGQTFTFSVKVQNLGSSKIKQAKIDIYPAPNEGIGGGLKFDKAALPPGCIKNQRDESNGYTSHYISCNISDLAPGASQFLTISGAYINLTDAENSYRENVAGGNFDKKVPTPLTILVDAWTYYTASSRLSVERIQSEYGSLLFQNNLLRQQKVGAVASIGSAIKINLDTGEQPFLDSTERIGLLLNWQKTGIGDVIYDKPAILMIITPKGMGPCEFVPSYTNIDCSNFNEIKSTCMLKNDNLKTTDVYIGGWCNKNNPLYTEIVKRYSKTGEDLISWACEQIENQNVVATNNIGKEFDKFSCTLNLGKLPTEERRRTDYVTAVAIYPYKVQSSFTIRAYSTQQ